MILQIKGTMCSGQTWAIEPYKNRPDIAVWDIRDFYKETGCIVNNEMDWTRWRKVAPTIPAVLQKFIAENQTKLTVLCVSNNRKVQEVLNGQKNISVVELITPDNKTLQQRAEERGEPVRKVLEFAQTYREKLAGNANFAITPREARLSIQGHLDNITVGIIGTAGRGEDAAKMSKDLYFRMYKDIQAKLHKLALRPEDITLASGGSAWADHLAVSLFLAEQATNLELFLPSRFFVEESRFLTDTAGIRLNELHYEFSKEMGKDTLKGLTQACLKGAKYHFYDGFQDRNARIAEVSDMILAYTWAPGTEPKLHSGTANTWNKSRASVKVHTSLNELNK